MTWLLRCASAAVAVASLGGSEIVELQDTQSHLNPTTDLHSNIHRSLRHISQLDSQTQGPGQFRLVLSDSASNKPNLCVDFRSSYIACGAVRTTVRIDDAGLFHGSDACPDKSRPFWQFEIVQKTWPHGAGLPASTCSNGARFAIFREWAILYFPVTGDPTVYQNRKWEQKFGQGLFSNLQMGSANGFMPETQLQLTCGTLTLPDGSANRGATYTWSGDAAEVLSSAFDNSAPQVFLRAETEAALCNVFAKKKTRPVGEGFEVAPKPQTKQTQSTALAGAFFDSTQIFALHPQYAWLIHAQSGLCVAYDWENGNPSGLASFDQVGLTLQDCFMVKKLGRALAWLVDPSGVSTNERGSTTAKLRVAPSRQVQPNRHQEIFAVNENNSPNCEKCRVAVGAAQTPASPNSSLMRAVSLESVHAPHLTSLPTFTVKFAAEAHPSATTALLTVVEPSDQSVSLFMNRDFRSLTPTPFLTQYYRQNLAAIVPMACFDAQGESETTAHARDAQLWQTEPSNTAQSSTDEFSLQHVASGLCLNVHTPDVVGAQQQHPRTSLGRCADASKFVSSTERNRAMQLTLAGAMVMGGSQLLAAQFDSKNAHLFVMSSSRPSVSATNAGFISIWTLASSTEKYVVPDAATVRANTADGTEVCLGVDTADAGDF